MTVTRSDEVTDIANRIEAYFRQRWEQGRARVTVSEACVALHLSRDDWNAGRARLTRDGRLAKSYRQRGEWLIDGAAQAERQQMEAERARRDRERQAQRRTVRMIDSGTMVAAQRRAECRATNHATVSIENFPGNWVERAIQLNHEYRFLLDVGEENAWPEKREAWLRREWEQGERFVIPGRESFEAFWAELLEAEEEERR